MKAEAEKLATCVDTKEEKSEAKWILV